MMRTVTFADESIARFVNRNFIPFWNNHSEQGTDPDFRSSYSAEQMKSVRDGWGSQRVFTLVVAPDGTTLSKLPGFWRPERFRSELAFAATLTRESAPEAHRTLAAELLRRRDGAESEEDRNALLALARIHEAGRTGCVSVVECLKQIRQLRVFKGC